MSLSGKQKRYLRSLGNRLRVCAVIGRGGVNANNIAEIKDAFIDSELLKVKLIKSDDTDRKEIAAEVAKKAGAELVQILGQSILIYKEDKENPEIKFPKIAE